MPKATLHGVLFECFLDLTHLDGGKEMSERIAVAAAQALERAGNLVAFSCTDLFAVKRQDNLDPLQCPGFIGRRFQELQRTESKALVIARDRVMGTAGRRGQGIQAHSLVEDKNRD